MEQQQQYYKRTDSTTAPICPKENTKYLVKMLNGKTLVLYFTEDFIIESPYIGYDMLECWDFDDNKYIYYYPNTEYIDYDPNIHEVFLCSSNYGDEDEEPEKQKHAIDTMEICVNEESTEEKTV